MIFLSTEQVSDFSLGCALEVRCQMYNEYSREDMGCSRISDSPLAMADSCIALVIVCTWGRKEHISSCFSARWVECIFEENIQRKSQSM